MGDVVGARGARWVLAARRACSASCSRAWGVYAWTQTQYFVGVHDGVVAIYRGIPRQLGPLELSDARSRTPTSRSTHLEPYERERIEATIRVDGVDEAHDVVEDLQAGS